MRGGAGWGAAAAAAAPPDSQSWSGGGDPSPSFGAPNSCSSDATSRRRCSRPSSSATPARASVRDRVTCAPPCHEIDYQHKIDYRHPPPSSPMTEAHASGDVRMTSTPCVGPRDAQLRTQICTWGWERSLAAVCGVRRPMGRAPKLTITHLHDGRREVAHDDVREGPAAVAAAHLPGNIAEQEQA
eukprot:COSAG01_NODE_3305_length_6292_cov_25.199903_3_plen_185_part_00